MDIKISIKDCECNPTVMSKNSFSEVEHKKKNMLYSPPQRDAGKSNSLQKNKKPPQQQKTREKANVSTTQQERALMQDLEKVSKNQASLEMIHNSNQILQRQNQILEDNQRTLHQMAKQSSKSQNNRSQDGPARNALREATEKVTKEVEQIKKIRDEIINVGKQVSKALNENRAGPDRVRVPRQISQMNANLKNLTQVSQNHLEGLQNLEALNQLQNFNVQAYMQSVNTLKKQIIQYQKESQNIEKELRIRAAKLQKLELPKNFDNQLLEPYQRHLKGKVDGVNLHAIKDAVYDKIGVFDYGRFECDVNDIMNEVKSNLGDFRIICKEHQIQVPTLKIDPKELKALDFKLPSILEEYKLNRGISFKEIRDREENQGKPSTQHRIPENRGGIKKDSPQKKRQIRDIITKPLDLAKNVPYTRKDKEQQKTILQTNEEKQRKQLQNRIKNNNQRNKVDEDFDKYLQNRAREELQTLYQQKRERMRKMQQELKQEYKQPVYIHLDLQERQNLQRETKPRFKQRLEERRKSLEKQQRERQLREREQRSKIEQQTEKGIMKQQENQHGFKRDSVKDLGKQALKEKLKQLLGKDQKVIPKPNQTERDNQRQPGVTMVNQQSAGGGNANNFAQGIINLLNNALTQVNSNLARNIEKRIQTRQQGTSQEDRTHNKSPARRINLPKLQQFRPPPTFNMNIVHTQKIPLAQEKIVLKDYSHLRFDKDDDDLCVSDISKDGDDD